MKNQAIKVGDIYDFRYNQAERDRLSFSAHHCFEGMLHAQLINGSIMLVDTYWGIKGDGRVFTPSEARQQGTLTFYVNLSEIESIKEHECLYYDDNDLYRISEQHACVPSCVHHFKRKGAERSNKKMLAVVNEQMREERKKIDWAVDKLQRLAITKEKIEGGDLTQYL